MKRANRDLKFPGMVEYCVLLLWRDTKSSVAHVDTIEFEFNLRLVILVPRRIPCCLGEFIHSVVTRCNGPVMTQSVSVILKTVPCCWREYRPFCWRDRRQCFAQPQWWQGSWWSWQCSSSFLSCLLCTLWLWDHYPPSTPTTWDSWVALGFFNNIELQF